MTGEGTEFLGGLADILSATDTPELRATTMAQLDTLGFGATYFLSPVTPDPRVGRILTSIGFPDEWARSYPEQFQLVDPLPGLALRRGSAFFWSEAGRLADLSAQARRYVDDLMQGGTCDGIAVPCFGPNLRCGFMGVQVPSAFAHRSDAILLKAQMIGQISFQRYCELQKPFDTELPQLSERELQVLTLICEGKSNQQIGHELKLSRGTVDVYLKRLFSKMEVNDRASASVQAVARGLVVSGEYPRESTKS